MRHYGDFLDGSAFMLPVEFQELGEVNVSLGFAIISEKSSWREEDGQPVTQLSLEGG